MYISSCKNSFLKKAITGTIGYILSIGVHFVTLLNLCKLYKACRGIEFALLCTDMYTVIITVPAAIYGEYMY